MLVSDFRAFRAELRRLAAARRRRLDLLLAVSWLSALLLWIGLAAVADFLAGRFRGGIRGLGFLGVVFLALVGCRLLWRRLTLRENDETAAARLGESFPGSGDSLVNAVQLAARGLPEAYLSSMLSESPLMDREIEVARLCPAWCRRVCLALAGAAAAVLLPLGLGCPGMLFRGAARVLLPWRDVGGYTRTVIESVEPGDAVLKRGEGVAFGCVLSGSIPDEVRVVFEGHPGQERRLPPLGGGRFGGGPPAAVEAGRYRFEAGDCLSAWYRIRLVSPPALLTWTAGVVPPAATGRPPYGLASGGRERGVPAGSLVRFQGRCTERLRKASFWQDGRLLREASIGKGRDFAAEFKVERPGGIVLRLAGEVEGRVGLPLVVLPDRLPRIVLKDTPLRQDQPLGAKVPVRFRAEDDYGVLRVGLERVMPRGRPELIAAAVGPDRRDRREFDGRFVVDIGSFGCRPGDILRIRCWAEDAPDAARRSHSPVVAIRIPRADDLAKRRREDVRKTKDVLESLLEMQRSARAYADRTLERTLAGGQPIRSGEVQELLRRQTGIRERAAEALRSPSALGGLADRLAGLVNLEMAQILRRLDTCFRLEPAPRREEWQRILALQTRIIAALAGAAEGLDREGVLQDRRDVFALIQRLVQGQRDNLRDTRAAQAGQTLAVDALVRIEERLAESLQSFQDRCLRESEGRGGDGFARRLRKAHDLIGGEGIYERMLGAAEELEGRRWPSAVRSQEAVLGSLRRVLDLLNRWRLEKAKDILEKAGETLAKTGEALAELEREQARIAEATRDLMRRGPLDDDAREKLAAMDREQERMADEVERLANDLSQFPELPVCGELNSRMREIFEDVQQAAGSEDAPAIEIAVQKEDALLDAIRSAGKRIEDVEMWLPDVPDNIVWNMESFDVDEFPDVPLVPLPDELEDIVGELLEQDAAVDAGSQDTTGNNLVADAEMGWSVMDGPMPSFAAKGKSGNTRPNDNEMTGRSGSGREGQASGELVEDHVKGYEGRKTHARRTLDRFQKGMVTEDKDSTADARATGGGKLGGQSETQGMFGSAPRRDLHTGSHGRDPRRLRQETEALYATARLLYLRTGSLGAAARDLHHLEQAPPRIRELGGIRRRVLRQLSDSQVEMRDGVVLPMPVATVPSGAGVSDQDDALEKVSDDYKDLLKEYYRSLD